MCAGSGASLSVRSIAEGHDSVISRSFQQTSFFQCADLAPLFPNPLFTYTLKLIIWVRSRPKRRPVGALQKVFRVFQQYADEWELSECPAPAVFQFHREQSRQLRPRKAALIRGKA